MTLENILKKSKQFNKNNETLAVRINDVTIVFHCVELDANEVFVFYITDPYRHNQPIAAIHKESIKTVKEVYYI